MPHTQRIASRSSHLVIAVVSMFLAMAIPPASAQPFDIPHVTLKAPGIPAIDSNQVLGTVTGMAAATSEEVASRLGAAGESTASTVSALTGGAIHSSSATNAGGSDSPASTGAPPAATSTVTNPASVSASVWITMFVVIAGALVVLAIARGAHARGGLGRASRILLTTVVVAFAALAAFIAWQGVLAGAPAGLAWMTTHISAWVLLAACARTLVAARPNPRHTAAATSG